MSEAPIGIAAEEVGQSTPVTSVGRDAAHQLALDIFAVAIGRKVLSVKTFGNATVFNSGLEGLTFKNIELRTGSDHYQVDYSVVGKKQRHLSVLRNPKFTRDMFGEEELKGMDEIVVISTYLKDETELPYEYPPGEEYLLLYGDNTIRTKDPAPNSPKAFEMARNMMYKLTKTK